MAHGFHLHINGAHEAFVALLALLTRCKLLPQIPRLTALPFNAQNIRRPAAEVNKMFVQKNARDDKTLIGCLFSERKYYRHASSRASRQYL